MSGKVERLERREVKMNGHVLSVNRAQAIRFPDPARARGKSRSTGGAAVTQDGIRRKPAWHVLYALVGVAVLFFTVADVAAPANGWRILAECLGTTLILGVMALWVRANRLALALAHDAPNGTETFRYVAYALRPSSQRPVESVESDYHQSSPAQTSPAEEEDPTCFVE